MGSVVSCSLETFIVINTKNHDAEPVLEKVECSTFEQFKIGEGDAVPGEKPSMC